MDVARRLHREQSFRIGVQVLADPSPAPQSAGRAFADLADAIISGLAAAALEEVERMARRLPRRRGGGRARQVRLARDDRQLGSRSHDPLSRRSGPTAVSAMKGWAAETFYRALHPAADGGPLRANRARAVSTRSTFSCARRAPKDRWRSASPPSTTTTRATPRPGNSWP